MRTKEEFGGKLIKARPLKLKIVLYRWNNIAFEIIEKVVRNRFSPNYKLTTGVDILTKDVEFRPEEIVTLSIWDIGAQQRFDFARSTFFKGATGAILVFDLTKAESFEEVMEWLTEIRQFAGENIPFILIGNKADLIEDVGLVINRDEARSFAENEGGIYIEISTTSIDVLEKAINEFTRKIIYSRT